MKRDFQILVVDDDPDLRKTIHELLSRQDYTVVEARSGQDAWGHIQKQSFDLVITDMIMSEMTGIGLLRKIKSFNEDIPVLMITGHSTIEDAVEAIKLGAENYIAKPFDNAELLTVVKRLYETKAFKQKAELLKQEMLRKNLPEIIGASRQIRKVLSDVESVAVSDTSVLITGESGTGKELVARSVHALSNRKKEPFVAINAAAVPKELLESEFFGHEKGAFSGAMEKKYGLFEVANEGTLFLDEIAEMPLDLQAKLLRTVETKKLRRLGGIQEISVDIRIVSATNRDLKKEIQEKRFREDLYFRLSTFCIDVPPLRKRKEDILLLAEHYFASRGYHQIQLSKEIEDAMQSYDWPGNVRELENALERAVLLAKNQEIRLKNLPAEIQELYRKKSKSAFSTAAKLQDVEKEHILSVYEACGKDKVQSAELLGIGLKTLYRKLKSYGIS